MKANNVLFFRTRQKVNAELNLKEFIRKENQIKKSCLMMNLLILLKLI